MLYYSLLFIIMQSLDNPGYYKLTEDLKINKVITCSDSKKSYPVMANAIIPKDSIVIHSIKYHNNDKYYMNSYGMLETMTSISSISKEMKNELLRTNQIIFTDIKKHNDMDTCHFRGPDELFTTHKDIQLNTLFKTELDTDFNHTYGKGFIFSLSDKYNKDAYEMERIFCLF